jgi:hypothetical protein
MKGGSEVCCDVAGKAAAHQEITKVLLEDKAAARD